MKLKIVKSVEHIQYDKKDKNSGKALILYHLGLMQEKHGVGVEIDMRALIIYAKAELLVSCLKYIRKLEKRGYLEVDRRWANVEYEHPYVAARVKNLMWHRELREAALEAA
jgi:hypothetical protein